MIISASLTEKKDHVLLMKKKAFYGDNFLIQVSLLQVSTVVTFFSEVSNLQHQKKVMGNIQKS